MLFKHYLLTLVTAVDLKSKKKLNDDDFINEVAVQICEIFLILQEKTGGIVEWRDVRLRLDKRHMIYGQSVTE